MGSFGSDSVACRPNDAEDSVRGAWVLDSVGFHVTQLSYIPGASDTPFIGDTIGVHFDRIVERFADREALIVRHQQVRWTYRELKERVDAFAAGLLALGLERIQQDAYYAGGNLRW